MLVDFSRMVLYTHKRSMFWLFFKYILSRVCRLSWSPSPCSMKIPLNSSTSLWCICHYSLFFIVCKLAKGALSPVIQVINGDVEQYGPQYWTLKCATSDWSPVRFHASGYKPSIPAAQPVFSLLRCLPAQSVLHNVVYENLLGGSVESRAKFKVNNIYCFSMNAVECCVRETFKVLSREWLGLLEKSDEFWQIVINEVGTTKQIQDVDELVSYTLSTKHVISKIT